MLTYKLGSRKLRGLSMNSVYKGWSHHAVVEVVEVVVGSSPTPGSAACLAPLPVLLKVKTPQVKDVPTTNDTFSVV